MDTPNPCGINRAIESNVIFATLCSKPDDIKANKHQNIIMSFPASSLIFKLHHTAKQTKILHNKPLKNNSIGGSVIFISAVFKINLPTASFANPALTNIKAKSIDPIKFPTKLNPHMLKVSFHVVFLFNVPIIITILFPVKSSDPAIITRLKAIPKDSPIISFT